MAPDAGARFAFPPGLPVPDVVPGTNLLVCGPSRRGAREIALDLVTTGSHREGVILVSADDPGGDLLERIADLPQPVDRSMLGIVDCAAERDDEDRRFPAHAAPIAGPGDLANIEVEFSLLYEKLRARDATGMRIGVFSLSTLLAHSTLRDVSRFLHVLTGRIIATEDLGVFLVDSTAQDDRTVETLGRFCDGRVEVRGTPDGGLETRVTGLDESAEAVEWASVGYEMPSLQQEDSRPERR